MISTKRVMENHITNAPAFKVWSWMWPPDLVVGYQCLPLQDNRCDKTADMLSSQKWLEYLKVLWNWQATFANSTGPLPILTAQWRATKIAREERVRLKATKEENEETTAPKATRWVHIEEPVRESEKLWKEKKKERKTSQTAGGMLHSRHANSLIGN